MKRVAVGETGVAEGAETALRDGGVEAPSRASDPRISGATTGSGRLWLPALLAVFFSTGFAALVFEVLWTRLVAEVTGATAVAMSSVFSAYVLGLAGGAWLGRRARRVGGAALRLFAALEVGVALLGLLLTWALLDHGYALSSLVGPVTGTGKVFGHMAATLALLGAPVVLMGATFPVLMNAVGARTAAPRAVALLYAANIAGAGCGALASGFVLIWKLGVLGTAGAAAGLDLVAAGVVLVLARRWPTSAGGDPGNETGAQAAALEGGLAPRGAPRRRLALHLAFAFVSGLTSLAFELLWGRLARLYLGDRTLAVSSLLFVYLVFLGVGGLVVHALSARGRPRRVVPALGVVCLAAASAHLLALPVMHRLLAAGFVWIEGGVHSQPFVRLALLAATMAVPVVLTGLAFPLVLSGADYGRTAGRTVGLLTAVNAVGSAIGAAAGGYVLPRAVGTLDGFRVTAVVLFLAGAAVLASPAGRGGSRRIGAAVALLFPFALFSIPADLVFFQPGERLIVTEEDEYGTHVVTRDDFEHLKVRTNRLFIAYKLGPASTRWAQESISYWSGTLQGAPRRVLNIGTGYGITAGAFTRFEELERLRSVELLPFVCRNQQLFESHNFGWFRDPRAERVCGDGLRELAARPDERWDVIAVNVLDPYTPGSSALFTRDFWELARSRLAPGGAYAQLIWGPDSDLLLRSLFEVFPHLYLFPAYGDSYNVVGFVDPPEEPAVGEVPEVLLAEYRRLGIRDPETTVPERIATAREVAARVRAELDASPAPPRLHTRNHPVYEFRWRHDRQANLFDSLQAYDFE